MCKFDNVQYFINILCNGNILYVSIYHTSEQYFSRTLIG